MDDAQRTAMTAAQHTERERQAREFFERYREALLARDERAVAELYAVPALVLFPGQSLPVSDTEQTAQFFASAWSQYEGVDALQSTVDVAAASEHSIWADVTWLHDGRAAERFMYQLVQADGGWRIAVLTPLELDTLP